MLRIKPLPEEKAVEYTKHAYESIKTALGVSSLPLYFQYLGNYPDYLGYLWNMLAPNIGTTGFHASASQLVQMAGGAISVIYTPSENARTLSSQIHPAEKEHIQKVVAELRTLNVTMMILTIAVRESLKGVYVASKQITDQSMSTTEHTREEEKTIDEIVRESLQSVSSLQQPIQLDTKAANMLVPVYGSGSLILSQYPAFFSLAAAELDEVMKTEAYLKARVEMEKITHILLMQLPSPIHISYVETAKMLFDKPHAQDLIFLMKDTFPAHFPKLVLATEMMEKILNS